MPLDSNETLLMSTMLIPRQDRLNDVLKRWQEYRSHLETTGRFLKEEFPHWLKDTDADVPDSKNDAQRKLEGVKVLEFNFVSTF